MKKPFRIKAGDEELVGFIASKEDKKPNFVFIHGAGTGNKERIDNYLDKLTEAGLSVLAFDLSGHGESTGSLKSSSLKKRVLESKAMIDKFADKNNLTVCASSMGGHIAIKLTDFFDIKNLILFCPGIYDNQAYEMPFDEKFTAVLKKPESWKNTDIVETLNKFTGKLLVIIGYKDDVIPKGVIEIIDNNSNNCTKKEILVIPNAVHMIHGWLAKHPIEKSLVINKIIEYSK